MNWVNEIIDILEKIEPKTKAIENAIHIFKYGNGWLTNDNPIKIFFFSDFYDDDNASK